MRKVASQVAVLVLLAGCDGPLVASSTGSPDPATLACVLGETKELSNGDFRIVEVCKTKYNLVVGDKKDENTFWTFRFSPLETQRLKRSCDIASATIDLSIENEISTDSDKLCTKADAYCPDLATTWIGTRQIRDLKPGAVRHLKIDMMEIPAGKLEPIYTPEKIKELVLAPPTGQLEMYYDDDALISKAILTLECSAR